LAEPETRPEVADRGSERGPGDAAGRHQRTLSLWRRPDLRL
jgi:hypothetical protein